MSSESTQASEEGKVGYEEREIVAVFPDQASLIDAVGELMQNGVEQADLSVLGDAAKVSPQQPTEKLADEDDAPRSTFEMPYTRNVVMTSITGAPALFAGMGAAVVAGGTMGAAFVPMMALVVGSSLGGGALGYLLARLYGHKHAVVIEQQIRNGGLLLWVRAPDPTGDDQKIDILSRHGGKDIHVRVAHHTWGVANIPYFNPDPLIKDQRPPDAP